MQVEKRNGKLESLSKKKIFDSINNANICVTSEHMLTQIQIKRITESVLTCLSLLENDIVKIDIVEDIIEKKLMEASAYEVAKRYITYRYEKERVRTNKALTERLTASNVQNQNANIDEFSFGGRIGEAAAYVMKNYALEHLISKRSKQNHINNEIYIHDLDNYAVGNHNCLSIPFDKLLKEGFTTRQVDIRPAGSINTAMQLLAVIFQLQSLQQFGGVSATHLDWTMVPYVRKSFKKHWLDGMRYIDAPKFKGISVEEVMKRVNISDTLPIDAEIYQSKEDVYKYAMEQTEKELDQAVEGLYHNLNSLQSRSGNQLPFTSINYGTCTLLEGRMVIKALIEGSIKGVGKFHKTSIFPCGIFQCMKNINRKPGDPNYDLFKLALKSTSLRLYPNYVNCDWSVDLGYDINNPETYPSTMGCRTFSSWDINADKPELKHLKDGRGNISPVTIILPTLAMQAKEKAYDGKNIIDIFMKLLDKKINEAKDMLIERFDWQCSQSYKSAKFMYENGTIYGYKPEEGIRSALKHGTFGIGQLGLAECLQILIEKDHTTEDGLQLAIKIETLFKEKCAKFKKDLKLNFGVYFTPAENLCFTSMKKFKEKYGEIENVSDHDFFTNSMHVPVWHKLTPFEKIDIESKLTGFSSAGCITYIELDSSAKNNIDAIEELVNYALDKDIPYFAINVPIDTCMDCGY
jgi:ribonucleoside-triphosphate reductase